MSNEPTTEAGRDFLAAFSINERDEAGHVLGHVLRDDPYPFVLAIEAEVLGRMMVPTVLLRTEWPRTPGLMSGDARFDEVYESIAKEGIREPLIIKADWTVIDGAHRLFTALDLGIKSVPVRVWTGRELLP